MPQHLAQFAKKLAHDAGRIAKRYQKDGFKTQSKSDNDLVTEADHAVDKFLIETIHQHFPEHSIITEESGLVQPKVQGNSDFKWIIDPIDGTNNFAHGLPYYAVSIAVIRKGKPIIGVIDIPMLGETVWAQEGQGAFIGTRQIHVSQTAELKNSLLTTGFPYNRDSKEYTHSLEIFPRFQKEARGVRRTGSAAVDLAYLAMGRFDGMWEYGLKSWDIAAGKIILEEAGGMMTNMDGSKLNPKEENMVASNGLLHQAILDKCKK